MDERVFQFKEGKPIPNWDLQHRLPISEPVGPECQDASTVFRINSLFMDVTDQPYRERQWQSGGVLIACFGAIGGMWGIYLTRFVFPSAGAIPSDLFLLSVISAFAYLAFKFGRDEFFSLRRRPIRFNRRERKIHAIRRRRFFASPSQGDVTWEVPWDENAIFCIHRGSANHLHTYHIRYYEVDECGNVTRAFAIGRKWEGQECLESLLSQWNYWCWYMNHGPADLPKPLLFFKEKEDTLESFLFCMYDFGMRASAAYRIVIMPLILMMTTLRLLALWTCRDPVWPEAVVKASVIDPDDPFDEPRGNTPVGWAETAHALDRHEYPDGAKCAMKDWRGEKDPTMNALLWAEDTPPMHKEI